MGVTYSRSIPGTGVPFKERFRTRPGGACLQAPSLKSKCQFWNGQQPKLREMILVKLFSGRFVFSPKPKPGRSGDRRSACFGFVTRRDYAGRRRETTLKDFCRDRRDALSYVISVQALCVLCVLSRQKIRAHPRIAAWPDVKGLNPHVAWPPRGFTPCSSVVKTLCPITPPLR